MLLKQIWVCPRKRLETVMAHDSLNAGPGVGPLFPEYSPSIAERGRRHHLNFISRGWGNAFRSISEWVRLVSNVSYFSMWLIQSAHRREKRWAQHRDGPHWQGSCEDGKTPVQLQDCYWTLKRTFVSRFSRNAPTHNEPNKRRNLYFLFGIQK